MIQVIPLSLPCADWFESVKWRLVGSSCVSHDIIQVMWLLEVGIFGIRIRCIRETTRRSAILDRFFVLRTEDTARRKIINQAIEDSFMASISDQAHLGVSEFHQQPDDDIRSPHRVSLRGTK